MELPSPQELQATRIQLDKELQILTNSYLQLQDASGRFSQNVTCIQSLRDANKDASVMVPLSSSVYVPGRLVDPQDLLVDIGTGYYVQKDADEAEAYYGRRIRYLKEQLDKLQEVIGERKSTIAMVSQALQQQATV